MNDCARLDNDALRIKAEVGLALAPNMQRTALEMRDQ
jgi:NOL1/NOP2/fmu family ribosome biogenesis protein